MILEDLFPLCMAASCPLRGQHKHLLSHQLEFLSADEKYVYMGGGYGSAKTLPGCALGVLLSSSIPGNFGFIGRRTYDKLHDSTQAIFEECVRKYEQETGEEVDRKENRNAFYHRYIWPNGSQVICRETKDIGRHLGPEYGWFLIDEAVEEGEKTFTGLMGRLRLPAAGDFLKGILLSNPPPNKRHWLVRWFGEEPGRREIKDPVTGFLTTFRYIKSSTLANVHLPAGYIESLRLLDPREYRRVVAGEIGFTPDGPQVYPSFSNRIHVGVPELASGRVLRRGWDFGFRHPACSWHDIFRCPRNMIHLAILHELDATEVEAEGFAKRVLKETARRFPQVPLYMIQDAGDAAGASVSDRGPGPIIRLSGPPWNLRFRFTKVKDVDPGLDLLRKMLRAGICACGLPYVQVHRSCANIIDGFLGGYHFPEQAAKDKPVKDGYYDDFMDSIRYVVWNLLRQEIMNPIIDTIERVNRTDRDAERPPWAWIEPMPTAEQVAAEIAQAKERARR